MSRLAPISPRDLQALLSRLGFRLIRQKGSHAFWQHEDGRATIVPVHKREDIGRGLLRQILRDLDLTSEAFAKLRRK
ncbi:MAG: type II toxin-antitoxin system HicA family toxin [Candidatus Methylomirabilales bacterium]